MRRAIATIVGPPMSLRFDDIEAFLNVAELNSVTSAAERMSLSKA
ncbi:hypothetical protein BANRA_06108 [Pseudomonas aeruginosa]|nr:hypothetical protein BANRA_06108 [Pseudomonas aeruginosa]